jgi:hypothetical protein
MIERNENLLITEEQRIAAGGNFSPGRSRNDHYHAAHMEEKEKLSIRSNHCENLANV